jgi:hypothetical protein
MRDVKEEAIHRAKSVGAEQGHELGDAMLLAIERSDERDHELLRQLARLAAREVSSALLRLRDAAVPDMIIGAYAHGYRDGIRQALQAYAAESELGMASAVRRSA